MELRYARLPSARFVAEYPSQPGRCTTATKTVVVDKTSRLFLTIPFCGLNVVNLLIGSRFVGLCGARDRSLGRFIHAFGLRPQVRQLRFQLGRVNRRS